MNKPLAPGYVNRLACSPAAEEPQTRAGAPVRLVIHVDVR